MHFNVHNMQENKGLAFVRYTFMGSISIIFSMNSIFLYFQTPKFDDISIICIKFYYYRTTLWGELKIYN